MWSNSTNHNVAQRVDELYSHARQINDRFADQGLPPLIYTQFNGEGIRSAESAEHHILPNLLAGDTYSTTASARTSGQINQTIGLVTAAKSEAQRYLYTQNFENKALPHQSFSSTYSSPHSTHTYAPIYSQPLPPLPPTRDDYNDPCTSCCYSSCCACAIVVAVLAMAVLLEK